MTSFDCRRLARFASRDHSIFIGRLEAVTLEPEPEPLVYLEGDYGLIVPPLGARRAKRPGHRLGSA